METKKSAPVHILTKKTKTHIHTHILTRWEETNNNDSITIAKPNTYTRSRVVVRRKL